METAEDTKAFGSDAWVHCNSHGRPHTTGWCTIPVSDKTLLKATNREDAIKECQDRGLWLYEWKHNGDEWPVTFDANRKREPEGSLS